MKHEMRLDEKWFELIKSGKKSIEYRLNDEKRQCIKIGDKIVFSKRASHEEELEVEVTDLKYYPDLLSMFTDNFNQGLNEMYQTPEEVVLDTSYYSDEEVSIHGCVAIYFKRI